MVLTALPGTSADRPRTLRERVTRTDSAPRGVCAGPRPDAARELGAVRPLPSGLASCPCSFQHGEQLVTLGVRETEEPAQLPQPLGCGRRLARVITVDRRSCPAGNAAGRYLPPASLVHQYLPATGEPSLRLRELPDIIAPGQLLSHVRRPPFSALIHPPIRSGSRCVNVNSDLELGRCELPIRPGAAVARDTLITRHRRLPCMPGLLAGAASPAPIPDTAPMPAARSRPPSRTASVSSLMRSP
jgi:hypothetical protein